jgi:hypothetical protein
MPKGTELYCGLCKDWTFHIADEKGVYRIERVGTTFWQTIFICKTCRSPKVRTVSEADLHDEPK